MRPMDYMSLTNLLHHQSLSAVQQIPLKSIYAVKRRISKIIFDNLKPDIQEHGLKTPVLLAKVGRGYHVKDGAHRIEVARALGLESVPARIVE